MLGYGVALDAPDFPLTTAMAMQITFEVADDQIDLIPGITLAKIWGDDERTEQVGVVVILSWLMFGIAFEFTGAPA